MADADVDEEYRRRNEKVKLDLAVFTANQFRAGIQPTDAELEAQFKANPETYRVPEKRRVRYLNIDVGGCCRPRMTVTPQEVEARYNQNNQTYSTPEQVRASHILFKTEGKDEAAVRKEAEAVLAKVKGGADFAALAKQYSEDDQSKPQGGDLDYFGRGAMAQEFEDAAWALDVGKISEIVKTPFGFHIIKLTDKKAATTRTLDEVRPQIEDQLRWEKAQAEAQRIGDEIAKEIDDPADLDTVAQSARADRRRLGSVLPSRSRSPASASRRPSRSEAFTLEQGKVSGKLRTNQGFAFIALTEIKPAYAAEARRSEGQGPRRRHPRESRRSRADPRRHDGAGRRQGQLRRRRQGRGRRSEDDRAHHPRLRVPEVGASGAVDDAVFALKAGETTAPISTDNAVVVARVTERQDVNPTELQNSRDAHPQRTAPGTTQPILRGLHDQGQREDGDRVQP